MRIAAIADIHYRVNPNESIKTILDGVQEEADVLVLAGDLTDTGLLAEAEALLRELQVLSLPIVAVLGNHDHESDRAEELAQMLVNAGIIVLDGTAYEIDGVGFIGTKGFCGGYGELTVQPFGERAIKTFINTSIDEALRLENALAKLDCPHKIAITHYSPIEATLEGEPPELYPFLGSSRLANALDRRGVDVIVHGHAHHGSPFGLTPGETPVHNVCRFVQLRHTRKSYCIFEI